MDVMLYVYVVYGCARVHVHVRVRTYLCGCESWRSMSSVFSITLHMFSSLSLKPGASISAGLAVSPRDPSHSPGARAQCYTPNFHTGAGDPNSGPHACAAELPVN